MTKELTLSERLEWVRDTLHEGGSSSLQLPDEDLADVLFSDFDTDTWSALHTITLDELNDAGLMSTSLRLRCITLRALARELIDNATRPVTGQFIRESEDWQNLRQLCDEALALLDSERIR